MTLISILLGLGLEHFMGALDRIRNRDWFDQYLRWLEIRCSHRAWWEGNVGLLLTIVPPLVLLALVAHVIAAASMVVGYLLAIAVFVYSLGPDFNTLIDGYVDALEQGDEACIKRYEDSLSQGDTGEDKAEREKSAIESVLICAHEHIFGVIFWFIILGMVGALLYCLVVRLQEKYADIHGGLADAVRNLHQLLMWPSSRLQALGFAIGGSLVDALEGWRNVDGDSLSVSRDVIATSGVWALQYTPELGAGSEGEDESYINWLKEAQALANRTLVVWLTVLGIMTIGGWLT